MRSRLIFILCAFSVLFAGSRVFAQTEAAKVFGEMTRDLQIKSTTIPPAVYVGLAERSLLDFIKKYPKTPEASKAHFLLGGLYASISAPQDAISNFQEFLKAPGKKSADEVAQAKYMMAMSFMGLDKFDEAEKLYREIIATQGTIDARIAQAASADLSRIGTLRKLKIGAPAIEISAVSHEGRKIRLRDYRGKVVLLDFWAVWCNPCRMEMPNVIGVYNEFHKKGFEIIGVSLDNDEAQFRSFIKDNKMSWPQIYDGRGWKCEIGQLYAVTSIPATYLLDRQGRIRFKNVREEELKKAVQQLIDEK